MHIEPFEFFMLRRAAVPTHFLWTLHQQSSDDFQKWEAALLDLFAAESFQEAVYLASPSLHHALIHYPRQGPERYRQKILFSLYKYLIRMSTRATPFGLFSATGTGSVANRSKLTGLAISQTKKTFCLQQLPLARIAAWLEKQDPAGENSRYAPNSSLYESVKGYRFIENVKNTPTLTEVDHFPEAAVLLKAAKGSATKSELVNSLGKMLTNEESIHVVQTLIDSGLLVSDLLPNVTGPDFQDTLRDRLGKAGIKSRRAQKLFALTGSFSNQHSVSLLENTTKELSGAFPELTGQPLFSAQFTATAGKITLRKKVLQVLAADFTAVSGMLRSVQQFSRFKELKRKFQANYGERMVPLGELIDSEIGTEYAGLTMQAGRPATLLEHLEFNQCQTEKSVSRDLTSHVKERLFDRALGRRSYKIEILESELHGLRAERSRQTGFYWLGELLADSAKKLDAGEFQFYLKAAGGESGLELMARFAQEDAILRAELLAAIKQITETDSELIHAEIAHIPDAKTASILRRPHLWPYEIPYLSRSTLGEDKQIPINDILVSLSAQGVLVLTSKRLSKRVIPHNTTAHNYTGGLPLYQLLSDIAFQDSRLTAWNWQHLDNFAFLPRVTYRHLILSPARWNFSGETRQIILEAHQSQQQWAAVRKQLRIPRYFQICQGDNLLLIDCENRFARQLFCQQLQQNDKLLVQEYLHAGGNRLVRDATGSYAHELVLGFKAAEPPARVPSTVIPSEQRTFHLGSQWLFVKIFVPVSDADQMLTSVIAPLCEKLCRQGQIGKWFYVRYFEPSHHLRIRFQLSGHARCWQDILSILQTTIASQLSCTSVEKVQTDTYERELERYQSQSFEQVESIFHQDSVACIKALAQLDFERDDEQRCLIALYGIDALLNDFGLNTYEKALFAKKRCEDFLSEFDQDETLTWQLNRKYRQWRPQIQRVLEEPALYPVTLSHCFMGRSNAIRQLSVKGISNAEISSYSRSKQLDAAIPASRIAALSAGEFVGMCADNPDQPLELKTFHCTLVNDHKAQADAQAPQKPLPIVRKVTPQVIEANYRHIKEDVETIIFSEMERMLSDPELSHLIISK